MLNALRASAPLRRPVLVTGVAAWLRLVGFIGFFVSLSCAGLVPTGKWTNVVQGGPSGTGQSGNTAVAGGRPHTFGVGTLMWKLGPIAVMCSGESSFARPQCASWNDITESWMWINTTGFSGPQQGVFGASWVDQSTSTIYVYGGHNGTPASCIGAMYRATVNTATGSVSQFTLVSTGGTSPGLRAHGASWQDSSRGVFYLFGGTNCDASLNATHNDLWAFFPSNSSWLLLNSAGSMSSVVGTPGVEAATSWPSIRRGSLTTTSIDGKYVYLFGGAQHGWDFPFGDLWRFNFATRRWTFMSGLVDQTHGSRFSHDEPAFDPDWLPAATYSGAMWMDRDGYLWLREGLTGSNWWSRDVWVFSTGTMQWGRNKGSYLLRQDGAYTSGSRFFSWPGYISGSVVFTKSTDASVAYLLHGFGWSTVQGPSPSYTWDIWRISTTVNPTPMPAAPRMPRAPAGHNPGMQAKWIQLASCSTPPTLSALTAASATVATVETGYLLRYEFGNAIKSMAPPQINRADCFAVQFSGYLWNPTTTLIPFRFLFVADSAVQVEWSTPGIGVMQTTSWWNTTAQPFAPHTMLPFYSETLLQSPGATWFRVTYFKIGGGSGGLLGGLVTEEAVGNYRMLHSSFVTQNFINSAVSAAVLPTVTWTPLDLRQATSTGLPPDTQTWPGYTAEGMKWEIWDWVFLCGAAIPESSKGCSAWKHSAQTFVWTNATSLTGVDPNGWKAGMTFVDPLKMRLYLVGGTTMNGFHAQGMWWANFNNLTGEIGGWTRNASGSALGGRSFAAVWQDDQYNFWAFSGGAYDANVNDMWVFNVSSENWTRISVGLPSNSWFNSSWSGIYGTEDAINWPSARTRSAVVRDAVNKNYVYMYGGAGRDRDNPTADLWRFNMQTLRWALLGGSLGNVGPSWGAIGEFNPTSAPPAWFYPQLHADRSGQYLWLWSGTPGVDSMSSVWCFRLSDRLWALGVSPFAKSLPTVTYGPPYWSQGRMVQSWTYNGTVYEFGGEEFGRDITPNVASVRRVSLWKATMSVATVSFPFSRQTLSVPPLPEPASNRAAAVSFYFYNSSFCPKTEFGFLSFLPELRRASENKTGALLNYQFGTLGPLPGIARPQCALLEMTGYYWNTLSTPQMIKFRMGADDGVQLQWRDRGTGLLSNSIDIDTSSWAEHGTVHFQSPAVVAYPGPNWFRVTHFDVGGLSSLYGWIFDADGVSNPRTFHSDFITPSVTKSIPEAAWTQLYNQSVSQGSSASPAPGSAPHFLSDAMFWQVGSTIFSCGGGELASSDCVAWNEEQSRWTWFGPGVFTPRVRGGVAFVDRIRRRLMIYGGQTESGYSNTMWYATYELATDSLTSDWQTLTVATGPGVRAWSTNWQDDNGDVWLWSGADTFPSIEATTGDMWRFNTAGLSWSFISSGPASGVRRIPVPGTPGLESATAWPGVRTKVAVGRARGSNYVYIFGGNRGASAFVEAYGDLWRFNMASLQWCYIAGEYTRPTAGGSFTDGFFSSEYQPSSSMGGALFVDAEGDVWMFGGESTPGAHAFLWTYSAQRGSFARVPGTPDRWETTASALWPGSMAGFGYFRSAFDQNSFLVVGGRGWNATSRGQLANVWRLRATYPYSATLPQEPSFTFDSNPAGFNVSYYEFTTSFPAYSPQPTWGTLVATANDASTFPLREDYGFTFVAASGVDRTKVWGVRYESFFFNPAAPFSFRFVVRADDGVHIQWGSDSGQVLQDSGNVVAYSIHGATEFTSAVLTAPNGYTFVRISHFDSGNGSALVLGMVDSDGRNYRPLHLSNFRSSAPGAVKPPDVPPPTASPSSSLSWSPSSFQFQSTVDLAPQDIARLETRLCDISKTITGRALINCTITPIITGRRAAGPHLATLTSGDAATSAAVSANLNQIRDTFVNSLLTPQGAQTTSPSSGEIGGGGGNPGLIAGVIVAVIIVLIAASIVAFILWRRRNNSNGGQAENPSKQTAPDNATTRTSYSNVALIAPTAFEDQKRPKNSNKKKPKKEAPVESEHSELEMQPIPAAIAESEPVFDLFDFKNEWLIPFDEIEIEKQLGAGAFGIVYAGSYNDTEVAIKQTNLNVGQNSLDEFKREAVLLLSIKPHPCVVQVLGISISESNIYMVMEYGHLKQFLLCLTPDHSPSAYRFCELGSLDTLVQSKKLSAEEKEKILDSAASGIAHLHRNGVVHRDIAARNVLVAAGLKAKIADFGMSRIVDKFELKGTTNASVGPIKYMAPESLTRDKVYSVASDCWTFGILCVEVWTGKPPHSDLDMLEAAVEIRDKGLHPPIPADMPHWLHGIVSKCFSFKPEDRITMKEIQKIFRHQRTKRAESIRGATGKDSLDN